MPVFDLSFASGESSLSVRRVEVIEAVSELFSVTVLARSPLFDLDLESLVGQPAALDITEGVVHVLNLGRRRWSGVVGYIEQQQAERPGPGEKPLSTYLLRIVPRLWLLTHRRNHRIFQHLTIPDITDKVLGEWGLSAEWRIDRGSYPTLEYKVQYGETDHAFLSRLWEEAGIAYTFPDEGEGKIVILGDNLPHWPARPGPPIHFVDNPNQAAEKEFVTRVTLSHEVRPGAHTLRDYDFRRPSFPLHGQGPKAPAPEDKYEQYDYQPHGFLMEPGKASGTPVADDKGVARHDQKTGENKARRALEADRTGRVAVTLETNVLDLWPGCRFSIDHHPHAELDPSKKLLVTRFALQATPGEEWHAEAQAVMSDAPYRPAIKTPIPRIHSVQSATVVGPSGQEIHTDEFGRVRVQFPWDREGKNDDFSSCWIRVSQGWAGTGYGMLVIPRIGHEVLVGFLNGNPDAPVVVGRVFNATERVPYKLPDHKTRSTWKSDSSMGSDGFNEIMFEDLKGKELVYVQAQKNLRKLVKNDETITVGNDRQKYVLRNELETTGVDRTEVTGGSRIEITKVNRTTVIGGNCEKLVYGEEVEKTDGSLTTKVGADHDISVLQDKRERVEGASHLRIMGKRNQRIDGTQSLKVGGDQHESVAQNHALKAGKEIHIAAGTKLVIEAAQDLTFKGPGGFVRIDSGGVTIRGTLVRINSGGSEGSGAGAQPEEPAAATEAVVVEPPAPPPDNVAITGFAQ